MVVNSVTNQDEMARIMRVSRTWNSLLSDESRWKDVKILPRKGFENMSRNNEIRFFEALGANLVRTSHSIQSITFPGEVERIRFCSLVGLSKESLTHKSGLRFTSSRLLFYQSHFFLQELSHPGPTESLNPSSPGGGTERVRKTRGVWDRGTYRNLDSCRPRICLKPPNLLFLQSGSQGSLRLLPTLVGL